MSDAGSEDFEEEQGPYLGVGFAGYIVADLY